MRSLLQGETGTGQTFPSQSDAETWLGEVWRDLHSHGVAGVAARPMLRGAVVRVLLPLAVLSAITSPTAIAAVLGLLTRPRAFTLLTACVIGSIAGWQQWLAGAAGYFLVWRLCLYGATAYGWVWMRRRLLARETDTQARRRLHRTEIAGLVTIVTLEASLLTQLG